MSHEVDTMAYSGQLPWHGLGTKVLPDLTPAQMMKKSGVDWTVNECPTYVDYNGERMETGQKALVRSSDNRILTIVGKDWHPVQNEEAFNFFHEFILAGNMEMHTAGSLRNGEYVWALAKVKESFTVFKDDIVESYLLFSNPHLYGKSVNVRFTPIRVVCNNTLTLSLQGKAKNGVTLNHRKQFDADEVKNTMNLASKKLQKYKEMAEFLGSKNVTTNTLLQYYNEVFPHTSQKEVEVKTYEDLSRNAKKAYEVLESQPGSNFAKGTWWQAANSITYITDHIMGRNVDNRLYSQWFGQNANRKLMAYKKAVEYAEGKENAMAA